MVLKYETKKLVILSIMIFSLLIPATSPILASDQTTISDPYYSDSTGVGNKQHRFITITKDPKWTSCKYISGQPKNGTYLKKGDGLYYGESGGDSTSLSFSLGYGCASVAISVPLGKLGSSHFGQFLKATSKGYYKIKAKKEIQPTITLIQYRIKTNGKWGNWGDTKVYMKKYEVLRTKATLERMD